MHAELERQGLVYESPERDPFNLLRVSDATWPADGMRVDRAQLRTVGKEATGVSKIQIHVERLLSKADGENAPFCRVRIQLENVAAMPARRCELFKRPFSWSQLIQAVNAFYRARMKKEQERFSWIRETAQKWQPQGELPPGALLLRLGRYSGFDCLSVDHFRRGWNEQKKQEIREIGSSRKLCETAGGDYVPFGWVMLTPE